MTATELAQKHPSRLTYADVSAWASYAASRPVADVIDEARAIGITRPLRSRKAAIEAVCLRLRSRLDSWNRTGF